MPRRHDTEQWRTTYHGDHWALFHLPSLPKQFTYSSLLGLELSGLHERVMAQELCIYSAVWEASLVHVPCHSSEFISLCLVHAFQELFLSATTPAWMPRFLWINYSPASIFYRSRMFISPIFYSGGQVASSSDILTLDLFTYKIFPVFHGVFLLCSLVPCLFFMFPNPLFHCFLFTPHPLSLCCLLFLSSCIEAFVSSHRLLWKTPFIFYFTLSHYLLTHKINLLPLRYAASRKQQ